MSVSRRGRLTLLVLLLLLGADAAGMSALASEKAGRIDRMATASIASFVENHVDHDIAALKGGLDKLDTGDIDAARAARDTLPDGSLDRHILAWAIAVTGGGKVPSAEIAAAAKALPGWPGMETLRRNSERALYRENPPPQAVIGAFAGTPPETAEGAIILARAYVAGGNADAARKLLGPFWRTATLSARDELAILGEFGALIDKSDHRFRMEHMLYEEQVKSAERVAPFADATALEKAWAAVLSNDKNAPKLMAAVPLAQRSPGYSFGQAKLLRRANRLTEAAAIMIAAPKSAEALVDPDEWWVDRRVLARALMDAGDIKTAYRVAATHAAESKASVLDAEFHAGWFALRGLGDAVLSAKHFARMAEIADGPMSLSRAYYWLGRAAEAGATGDPAACFRRAATYGTTFYGQLSAQRLGLKGIDLPYPEPSDQDRQNFARREAVHAIDRLEQAGQQVLADRLYRDLADELTSPGELALLAAKAERRGNHFLALKIGKSAANRGINIGALAHPIGVIPDSANISAAGKALAYAVARQESEFNIAAVSGAGARGLLQLLPGTARDLARQAGLPYSAERLTTDAGYNATLGSAFLAEQLGRFKGSYILTLAGYNAGPKRAAEWVTRYGDPRGKDIDAVVDWIERIPFTETRTYVQRVMENYQVYKMRLTGKFDLLDDLVNGRSG